MEDEDVKRLASSADYARYQNLALKRCLQQMPEFRWCSVATCGSGQLVDGGELNSFFSCVACKVKTCYRHKGKRWNLANWLVL